MIVGVKIIGVAVDTCKHIQTIAASVKSSGPEMSVIGISRALSDRQVVDRWVCQEMQIECKEWGWERKQASNRQGDGKTDNNRDCDRRLPSWS